MIGKRSLVKDIEAQVAVVTSNHRLRESLHKVNTCYSCSLNKVQYVHRRGSTYSHMLHNCNQKH